MDRCTVAYVVASCADVAAATASAPKAVRIVTKPLLMPTLAARLSADGELTPVRRRLRRSVALSWLGDIALLAEGRVPFVVGLGSFLAAHVNYVAVFAADDAMSGLRRHPWRAAGGAAAAMALTGAMASRAGSLRGPVIVYGAALAAMATLGCATGRRWVGPGAVLFVVSDALLASGMFGGRLSGRLDGVVMATYALGQGLIVHGYTLDAASAAHNDADAASKRP